MASQTQGIQQLLGAEKRSADKVFINIYFVTTGIAPRCPWNKKKYFLVYVTHGVLTTYGFSQKMSPVWPALANIYIYMYYVYCIYEQRALLFRRSE